MSEPTETKTREGGLAEGLSNGAVELSELTNTLWKELESWLHGAVAMLPNLLIAVTVVLIGWFAAKLASNLTRKALDRVSQNAKANSLFSTVARVAVMGGALFVALGVLELDKTVTSLLAGVGVLGLALGFAFQDIAANFMSGILMAFRHEFRQGDIVESNGFQGVVTRITLRSTHLRRFSGEEVVIPNKDVFSNPLENYSANRLRRVDVEVGVAYGSDLALVERTAREALEGLEQRVTERDVDVLFTGFGGSSIDLVGRFWVEYSAQRDFLAARSDAIKAIDAAFAAKDIDIPFPIRTLRLADDLVQGLGERMDAMTESANNGRDSAAS